MKKTLLFLAVSALFFKATAQEMIKGGNMEDESAWTVIDVGDAFDASTISFNYTDDIPSAGKGGCLSISGSGVTRNFIYQKVTLVKGHTYYLSCALKNAGAEDVQNYWIEVNLVNREPVLVGEGTAADFEASKSEFQLGMHYWKNVGGIDYSRIETGYDGLMEKTLDFAYLGADNGNDLIVTNPRDPNFVGLHGDSIIFTLPDTVSTTDWYVLIKAGEFMTAGATEPIYNWLLDELTLWDMSLPLYTSVINPSTNLKAFKVFPNPVTNGIVNIISGSSNETTYQVYNTLGILIKSGLTKGSIDTGNLSKGLYILSLENGPSTEQYKLLIK
jgi:hypothetical protein